jgi:hypothetical protein
MREEPNWESENAVATRAFLESVHGQRFIERLKWLRPNLDSRNDATTRLIESGVVEGYEACVDNIILLQLESKPVSEGRPPYPDLDDDKQWDDESIVQQNSTNT